MLYLTVPATEVYDEKENLFTTICKEQKLQLEHSLVSLSKWEAKWKKPYLATKKEDMTIEQSMDYVRCMTITQNVDPKVYVALGTHPDLIKKIQDYIDDPMTATWFAEDKQKGNKPTLSKQIVTSEIIYYQMASLQIPFECEKWHLNRLLTLIRVCIEKNKPQKQMTARELAERNSKLNAQRLAKYKTRG